MKNKAVIYGAGYYGPKVFNVMRRYFDIVAFADQDPVKQGTLFCGLPVLSSDAKELSDIQIIMGCQDEKAEEWCKSLTPAVIPFSLSQLLIWQQEEEEASHFELSEDELSETRLLPDRIELLRRIQKDGGVFAEVGVFRGDFSRKILEICHPSKLYLIDRWQGTCDGYDSDENYRKVLSDCKREIDSGIVKILKGDSRECLQGLEDCSLDFCYLDTCHDYLVPHSELNIVKTKIKTDGLICGHDYCNRALSDGSMYGVKNAVNEFCCDSVN